MERQVNSNRNFITIYSIKYLQAQKPMKPNQNGQCDKIHSSDWLTGNIPIPRSLKTKIT